MNVSAFAGLLTPIPISVRDGGWIKKKDGMEVSYRWFPTKEKAEAFEMNKLSTAVDLNTKAVAEMVNLLRTNVQR